MKKRFHEICSTGEFLILTKLSIYFKAGFFDFLFGEETTVQACKCKCGIPNRRQRLLGGTDLKPYEFPWLGQIIVENSPPIEATLINDRYVITAASTVYGFSPYNVKVELGAYDNCYADVTSETFSVSNIIIHPEFQYITRTNDIALLRLSTVVPFQKRISPVCLPTPSKKQNFVFLLFLNFVEVFHF